MCSVRILKLVILELFEFKPPLSNFCKLDHRYNHLCGPLNSVVKILSTGLSVAKTLSSAWRS